MAKRKPKPCAECKDSAETISKLTVSFGCEKHGMTKFNIGAASNNQMALIAMLNWYIDMAGPDLFLEAKRLADEGDQRAKDIVMVREKK